MTHDVDAIYHRGVFQPVEPLVLPEGIRVHLRVESPAEPSATAANTAQVLSPRLARPEQASDFQMEVRDLNGIG
jgi:predicted DNA-binding antitoxin AbrB/MazE fold protein